MSETYRTRNVKFKNNDLKLEDIYIQTPYIFEIFAFNSRKY